MALKFVRGTGARVARGTHAGKPDQGFWIFPHRVIVLQCGIYIAAWVSTSDGQQS